MSATNKTSFPRGFRGLCFDHGYYGRFSGPIPRFNFFPRTQQRFNFFCVWPATSLHLSSALHAAPSSRADASVTADGRLANPAPRRLEGCREGSAAAAHSSSCRSAPTARRQPVTTTTHHRQAKATTTRARRATGSPRRRWSRPRLSSGRDSPRMRGSRSRRARASQGRWSGATPPRRATRRRLRRSGRGGSRAPRRRRPRPPRPPRPRTRRRRPRRRSLIRGRSTIPPLCCRLRRRPRPQPRLPHRLPRRRRLPTQLRAQWRDQLRDNLYHKYNSTGQFADACKSSSAQS